MTQTLPTTTHPSFLEAAGLAAASRSAADGRTLLGVARAFASWAEPQHIDPLSPTGGQVARFIDARGYKAAAKVRWAIRATLRAAGSLADEHGLGTGVSSAEFDHLPLATRAVADAFLSTVRSRQGAWRSGMRKLVRWCAEMEIDLLEVSAPDLDDYRDWIRLVGGSEGELLVIARRFIVFQLEGQEAGVPLRA